MFSTKCCGFCLSDMMEQPNQLEWQVKNACQDMQRTSPTDSCAVMLIIIAVTGWKTPTSGEHSPKTNQKKRKWSLNVSKQNTIFAWAVMTTSLFFKLQRRKPILHFTYWLYLWHHVHTHKRWQASVACWSGLRFHGVKTKSDRFSSVLKARSVRYAKLAILAWIWMDSNKWPIQSLSPAQT